MFEDVCLVCGTPADGLYCSEKCRDKDAAHLPPSQVDDAIDLGFITDSLPPLVSSTRKHRHPRTSEASEVSSPTSSVLTTPSAFDDTDSDHQNPHLALPANHNHLLPPVTTPSKFRKGIPQQRTDLTFVRRPGRINAGNLQPLPPHHRTSHRRTASFNPIILGRPSSSSSGSVVPHEQVTGTGLLLSSSTNQATSPSGTVPPTSSSGLLFNHLHHAQSTNTSSSAASTTFSTDDDDEVHQLSLGIRLPASNQRAVDKDRARKKRARASLPAYFSNLVINVAAGERGPMVNGTATTVKVPSTAVSSAESSETPSPTTEHPSVSLGAGYVRETRHSGATVKPDDRENVGIFVSPSSRTNSGLSIKSMKKVSSPTTPTSLATRRMASGGSIPTRGRDTRVNLRPLNARIATTTVVPDPSTAVVCPITATRDRDSPSSRGGGGLGGREIVSAVDAPASFAERHIRFIASASRQNRTGVVSGLRARAQFRSPPPQTLSAGITSSPPAFFGVMRAETDGILLRRPQTPKTRRFSSPTTLITTNTMRPAVVPFGLMMSPRSPYPPPHPNHAPVMRGLANVFGEDDENEDADEEDEDGNAVEEEEREVRRGRSRSRSRMRGSRSRGRRSRTRERDGSRGRTRTRSRGMNMGIAVGGGRG